MNPFKNIRIKTVGWLFALSMMLGGAVLVAASLIVDRNATSIQATWDVFKEGQSEKARALNALRREIGYGGMIHQFKNYILRKDETRLVTIDERLGGALAAISRYQALGVSTNEQTALAAITATLDAYVKAPTDARRLIALGKTASELDAAIKVDDGPALEALENLEHEISAVSGREGLKTNKARLLSSLYKSIGYGGVIHRFKNFILRHDHDLIETVNGHLKSALDTLDTYSKLETTDAEISAIIAIRATLGVYSQMLPVIDKLSEEGKSPEDIDRIVFVDDRPALAGLATLTREIAAEIQVKAAAVEESLVLVSNLADLQSLLVLVLTGFLISVSLWLINFQIVGPITRLTQVMTRLAGGNTDVTIPETDTRNEMGEMARSVEVFRENAIERLRAEQSLRDSEERGRAVLESVVDGIIVIDDAGIIESVNPAAEIIFGYDADDVVGKNVRMLMPEPYHGEHDGYLSNYLNTGEAKVIGIGREVTGLRKDGSEFPMELGVSGMQVAGKRMFTGIVRDITERKKVDKMKTEFISTVSHELRTPLTSIMGSLGLVRGGAGGDVNGKALSMIDIAYNNSDRLIRLINDILDSEKLASGKMDFRMETLDVMELVNRAIEENKGYGEEHNVTYELKDELPGANIYGDADRLLQVLANLMSNAAKFSPGGAKVELSVTKQDRNIRLAVTDHGPGIPEEFRPALFDRFTQSASSDTRQKGGTGLGLSITKAIAERHGGAIGFETETGKGSTFYVDLPDRTIRRMTDAERGKHTEGHILICEDEPDVARLLQMILDKGGFSSDIACNAEDAKSLLAKTDYAAMTLDLMLPGQSGISLLKELRDDPKTRSLPIVVISAKAAEGKEELNGDAIGVIDWLEKPIDEDRLMADMEKALQLAVDGKPRILHVEDDPDILSIVHSLVGELAEVVPAMTVAEARDLLERERFNLVILDLMLPDGSGEELLPFLHDSDKGATPIIVFSAREVSDDLGRNIAEALVKSRTSNDRLLDTIRSLITN